MTATSFNNEKPTKYQPYKQNQRQKHRFATHAFELFKRRFHTKRTHRHRKDKCIEHSDRLNDDLRDNIQRVDSSDHHKKDGKPWNDNATFFFSARLL